MHKVQSPLADAIFSSMRRLELGRLLRAAHILILTLFVGHAWAGSLPAGTLRVAVTASGCTDSRASAQSVGVNTVSGRIDLTGFCPNSASFNVNATIGLPSGSSYTESSADLALSGTSAGVVPDAQNAIASFKAQIVNGGNTLAYTVELYGPANDSLAARENAPLTIQPVQLSANDGVFGTLAGHGAPAHGTLTTDASGNWVYTPNADYTGADSFTYSAQSPGGAVRSAQVALDVQFVNRPPSFTLGADITVPNNPSTVGPHVYSAWASNFSPGPAGQSGQTLTATTTVLPGSTLSFDVPPSIDPATGDLSFTVTPIVHGSDERLSSGTAQVQVSVKNSGGTALGGQDTTTKTFTITVDSIPIAMDESYAHPWLSTCIPVSFYAATTDGGHYSLSGGLGMRVVVTSVNGYLTPYAPSTPPPTAASAQQAHRYPIKRSSAAQPPFVANPPIKQFLSCSAPPGESVDWTFAEEEDGIYIMTECYVPFTFTFSGFDSFTYTAVDCNGNESWPATLSIQVIQV